MSYRPHDEDFYDDERWETEHRPRRRISGCRGWAAYDGPCGALDCPTCHPEILADDHDEMEEE